MRFINRVSDYPNKKILHVSHASYSNGELSELHVTEEKDEGTVTVTGTELNAENLNKAFEEFGRNRFFCIYLREMFGLIIDEDDFSFDLNGNNSSKTVNFSCELNMIYPDCEDDVNLNVACTTDSIAKTGSMVFTPKSSLTSATVKRIYVNFYTNTGHEHVVVTVPFLYTFTPSSTNPLD